ncbi:uncharacterized protein LOC122653131 isoform X2 [Telopea speciosissima]|uniref:uncharacterized protein LOC122653131 isoform X2 n=1 Tax=Telopea speciosissima TaxID=54955 RepID=UPI001CC6BEF1|nr:uncharacterized protein LOC122653131 isoform X2 [Telopea speciosissima]
METDLSLIEMSGEEEDESLLLLREDINKDKEGNTNGSLLDLEFSCSPLCTLRSKRSSADASHPPTIHPVPDGSEVNEGGKKPCCSSPPSPHEGIVDNKENLDKSNLLVSPNMKAGQQQMKRRKKGGGYNMRKSIAWNRAFFTEEGVLDSEELSLLSESFSKPSPGSLYTVKEEEQTSLSECSISSGNGSNVHSNKEKLFKELPARPSDEVHKVCGGLLPKLKSPARENTAPMHRASQKVQLTKGIHSVGSRQGSCPQPVGSTSQKQLPNRNATSATKKESKLPKFSATKPDSSSIPTTPKTFNLSTKQSRSSQNGATAVHAGRNSGLKGNLSNAKKTLGCTPSSTKSSVRSSLKVLANSHSKTQLAANPKTLQDRKGTKIGLKVASDPTIPAADMQASTGQAGPGKTAVLLPQNSQYVGVDNQNNVNFQPTKPSGLRMPSPSLRYFDQTKASTLRGLQCQMNTQPYSHPDANVPNSRKDGKSENIGMVTALHAPLPMVGHDATTTRTMGHLSSGNNDEVKLLHAQSRLAMVGTAAASNNDMVSVNSTLGCSIPSAPASSHPTPKSSLELKNQYKVEIEVPSHLNGSYDTINCQDQQAHGVSDCGNKESANLADVVKPILDEIDHIPHDNKQRFHMNDNMLLIRSGSPEQSHKSNDFENHHDVCPQNSYSRSSASEISQASSPSISTMAEKGVLSGKEGLIKHPIYEGVALESISCSALNENHDVFSDTVLSDATECCNPGTSMPSADCLPAGHGLREESNEQLEVREPGAFEFCQTFHKDNLKKQMKGNNFLGQRTEEFQEENDIPTELDIQQNFHMDYEKLEMNDDNLVGQGRPSEELQKVNNHCHVSDVNPESRVSDGTEFGSSHFSSNLSSVSQVQVGTPGTGNVIKSPNVEDPKLESLHGDLSFDRVNHICDPQLEDVACKCNTGSLVLHNDCLRLGEDEYSGNQAVLRNSFPNKTEQMLQMNEHTLLMDNEALLAEMRFSKEAQQDNDPDNLINITLKRKDCNASESQSPHVLPQLKLAKQDIEVSAETSKVTKQSHVQDAAQLNISANRNVLLDAIHADLFHNDNTQDGELQNVTETGFPLKVNETSVPVEGKTVDGSKPDSLPQQNIVPFSDEWLAALETAGEEILTRKSGAVQNSPPDKSLPEPSPWSPVKRKSNQEIGPFDCTKYTNLPSSPK